MPFVVGGKNLWKSSKRAYGPRRRSWPNATLNSEGREECIRGVPSRLGAALGILLAYIRLFRGSVRRWFAVIPLGSCGVQTAHHTESPLFFGIIVIYLHIYDHPTRYLNFYLLYIGCHHLPFTQFLHWWRWIIDYPSRFASILAKSIYKHSHKFRFLSQQHHSWLSTLIYSPLSHAPISDQLCFQPRGQDILPAISAHFPLPFEIISCPDWKILQFGLNPFLRSSPKQLYSVTPQMQ